MTEEQKIQFLLRAYKRGVPMLRAYRILQRKPVRR